MYYVYVITNTVNGKKYVGKTSDPDRRWREHKRASVDGRKPLYRSMRKHGINAFAFDVFSEFETEREAFQFERQAIAGIGTRSPGGYNLSFGGEGPEGYRHTEEARKKISEAGMGRTFERTDEHRENISSGQRRRFQDDSQREMCREILASIRPAANLAYRKWCRENPYRKQELAGKITRESAEEIRELYLTGEYRYGHLADLFGIQDVQIGYIIRGECWGPLPEGYAAASEKIRRRRPSTPGKRVVTKEMASAIRAAYRAGGVSQRALAKEYRISVQTVCNIVNRVFEYAEAA